MGKKPDLKIDLKGLIENNFQESITINTQIYPQLISPIEKAIFLIHQSLVQGGKIMVCGNGGSAADSQHFSAELLNRFETERKPLPAIALTTDTSTITSISNDYAYKLIFAKQIQALAKPNDVLVAISTSGNAKSIIEAIIQMHNQKGKVVALTGNNGGRVGKVLANKDLIINIPTIKTARIQELHILVLHLICAGLDKIYQTH